VARDGASVFVVTPHFSSHNSYADPTHRRHLAAASFDYLTGQDFPSFRGSPFRFEIAGLELTFGGNFVLDNAGRYRVKALTEIGDFNAAFGTSLSDEDYATIGGLVIHQLGRLPKRNEVLMLDNLRLQVLRADSRRVHTLLVDQQRSLALNPAE